MRPNFSIITTAYNAASTISSCLESSKQQTYPTEHIIIDGASTDGTVEIIKKYIPAITTLISEPDQGIYDALNKGIKLATGEVIGILHADDMYAGQGVLAKVAKVFQDPFVHSCYGDLIYVAEQESGDGPEAAGDKEKFRTIRYWKSGEFKPEKFYWGWMPPHPTFFVRRAIYEKYGLFNLNLGTAADYEIMLRFLLKHRISTRYIPEVLVKMRTGGVSNASLENRIKANKMDRQAWRVNGLMPYPWTLWMKPARKIGQYFLRPSGQG